MARVTDVRMHAAHHTSPGDALELAQFPEELGRFSRREEGVQQPQFGTLGL